MMNKRNILCIFAFIFMVSGRDVEIENFEPDSSVKSDDFLDFGTLRLKKNGKNNFTISGDFELLQNSGNEKEIILEVRKNNDKNPVLKKKDKFCEFLKNDDLIWPDVQANSDLPEGNPCPLPKGKYSLTNYAVDEKKFSKLGPGNYVATVFVTQNDDQLFKINVKCKINA